MDTSKLIILLLYFFVPPSFINESYSQNIEIYRVGDVVFSCLPPDSFYKAHGQNWKLLSSKEDISGSDLHHYLIDILHLSDTLPEAGGNFIRGMGKDEQPPYGIEDANPEETVGRFQNGSIKNHIHWFKGNTGKFLISGVRLPNGKFVQPVKQNHINYGNGFSNADVPINTTYSTCSTMIKNPEIQNPTNLAYVNVDPNEINSETRPINLQFFVYIKINN